MKTRQGQYQTTGVRQQISGMLPQIILAGMTLFCCWLFVGRIGAFGAKVDWISQHSVFPEYFRQLFYETGDFFPEFAAQIGGGQNIYNFAYYGLYNPVILLSYLLPFVSMSDYLMAAQIVSLMAAVQIFYIWLRKQRFPVWLSFWTSLLFLLAGPMIYHSYKQMMFVNYMPFLCLGLLGVDRYFEKRRQGLLAISNVLMILTSFYFSIGGMLVLCIYGIYRYMQELEEEKRKVTVKGVLREACLFALPFVAAVFMCAFLLVPTAVAIVGGRAESGSGWSILSLLIPNISAARIAYEPYGVGLTTLTLTALISGLTYPRFSEKILHTVCVVVLTVPLFSCLLNGGLYMRDKVFIPFLPLLCYMTAQYIYKTAHGKISLGKGVAAYLLTSVVVWGSREGIAKGVENMPDGVEIWWLVLAESVVLLLFYLQYRKKRKSSSKHIARILIIPSVCCLFGFNLFFHGISGEMLSWQYYEEVTDEEDTKRIQQTLEQEDGLFRTEQLGSETDNAANLNRIRTMRQYISSEYSSSYNQEYLEFRNQTFQVEEPFRNVLMQSAIQNPIWRKLMGIKYILSEKQVAGYDGEPKTDTAVQAAAGDKDEGSAKNQMYQNETVLPVVYATNHVITEEIYRTLEFPLNQMAFAEYAVVQNPTGETLTNTERSETEIVGGLQEQVWEIPFKIEREEKAAEGAKETTSSEDFEYDGEKYLVNVRENTKVSAILPEETVSGADTVFVQFQIKNRQPQKDVTVWMEGIRNKLTSESHVYANHNTRFTYVTALEEGQKSLEMILGKGEYEITDMHCFAGNVTAAGEELCQAELLTNQEKTGGNRISGTISVPESGYLITSIPYDEGFEIQIDGKRVETERVNTAFLGCRTEKGNHEIEIVYKAPGVRAGKVLSVLGCGIFLIMLIVSRRTRGKRDNHGNRHG